jgi:hypothetical protein
MSYWSGGDFYGMPDLGRQKLPKGYYKYDSAGRLQEWPANNSIPLAACINPRSGGSHNPRAPPLPPSSTVTVETSLLANWHASLSDIEALLDDLLEPRASVRRFARAEMRRLLANLRAAIARREEIDRS